ncbi:MAG: ArsR/SmtB family transcription factor [Acidimicrobiia bacterium]
MYELSAVHAIRVHRDSTTRIPQTGLLDAMRMALDRALEALADPTRRKLVETLASGPQSAGSLARPFEISRPAVSRHLRVLRDAQLVEVESQGRRRMYRLSEGTLEEVRDWLEEVGRMWDEALLAFKRHAEARR